MFVKVYNQLFNYKLSPNALKVYVYLTMRQNALYNAILKVSTISRSCGIASATTVHTALAELESKGLVVRYRRRNREGDFIANGYRVTPLSGKWFALPLDNCPLLLNKSSFATYIYLLKCANARTGKAFPSISAMAKCLCVCRNTIIAAIKHLIAKLFIIKAALRPGKRNLYHLGATSTKKETRQYPPSSFTRTENKKANCSIIIAAFRSFVKQKIRRLSFHIGRVVQKLNSRIKTHPMLLKEKCFKEL